MLLRISLVIAILAGAATLFFGFKVGDRITTLNNDLAAAETARSTAEANELQAKAAERKAREAEEAAKTELAAAKTTLENTTAKLTEQEKRANDLDAKLTETTAQRNEAQTGLARWEALGVTIEQVQTLRDQLYAVNEARDALADENKILLRNNDELRTELKRYTGPVEDVALPAGLKGRILAVDPKYDFVVLDIGGNQGVLKDGKMLVNRDGKLIGKVRVTKVEPSRSIANIMPDWKQGEVMEGDQVIY